MTEESTVVEESDFEDEFKKLAESKDLDSEVVVKVEEPESTPEDVIVANDGVPVDEPEPEKSIYDGLTDEAKAHFEKIEADNKQLNHRISSDDGRVRAYQRQTQDLQSKIQELNDAGDGPSTIDIAEAMKGGSETWNKFAEDYPEIAEVFDQRATETGEAIQKAVDQALAPMQEQYNEVARSNIETQDATAKSIVSDEFENWDNYIGGEQGKIEFGNWMAQQPPGIQDLAESSNPSDAIAMISLYENDLVANGQPSLKKATPDTGVETADNQQQMEADKLKAKRKQQLEDGTTVKSRGAKVNTGNETVDDFGTAFEFFANKKERKRA